MLPPYAPPVYHSVENFQEYGISSCIVPPPVFDPTDLPPPYSSQNPSLADSQNSLSSPESSNSQPQSYTGPETDVHFQAVHTSCQAGNRDEELAAPPPVTRSSPSEGCHLQDSSVSWGGHPNNLSDSTELLSASGLSDLSNTNYRSSSEQERRQADVTQTNIYRTVVIGATPLVNHPTCSSPRTQAEFSELVRASTRSRKRTSSLGLLPETSVKGTVNTRSVTAVSRSPVRGTPILSLRTRSRSLGENSIYVNSFEVMARPPPNMPLPADELLKPCNTGKLVNTRNAGHQRSRKGTVLKGDSLKEHNGRRGEQRKEKVKHRRRRHSHSIPRHKDKRNVTCELLDSQVNRGHEDSATPGKETVV